MAITKAEEAIIKTVYSVKDHGVYEETSIINQVIKTRRELEGHARQDSLARDTVIRTPNITNSAHHTAGALALASMTKEELATFVGGIEETKESSRIQKKLISIVKQT